MLDPQARAFLDRLALAKRPPIFELTPAQVRAGNQALTQLCAGVPVPMASVVERTIDGPGGGLPLRIYTPHEAVAPAPVLVYFHGGGFVIGDLAMVDEACRLLAQQAGAIVVSVDYRLAPEHRYPAPQEDAFAATAWVAAQAHTFGGDPARIAVGGDSAGGTLAAVVAVHARDRGGPKLCFALLVYPGVDPDASRPSMLEFGDGYLLTSETMRWFWHQRSDGPAAIDPYLAPLVGSDLRGLPPTLIITAGFDPLRDGGEAYGERLRAAGVPTEIVRYDGMIHAFFTFPAVFDVAREAIGHAALALRRATAVQVGTPSVP